MGVNFKVNAEIFNIKNDVPQKEDKFLVDTNAWFWTSYTRASIENDSYQLTDYPEYLDKIVQAGAKIFRTSIALIELSSIIEKTECDIFKRKSHIDHMDIKKFRHGVGQEDVIKEIESAWSQICQMSEHLDIQLDNDASNNLINLIKYQKIDGYDRALLLPIIRDNNIRVISDDSDLSTVPWLKLHTSNSRVIKRAMTAGRLSPPRR